MKEWWKGMNRCKGLFWRVTESNYYDKKKCTYSSKRQLRLLKRQSCPGCLECDEMKDIIADQAENCYFPDTENSLNKVMQSVWDDMEGVNFVDIKHP